MKLWFAWCSLNLCLLMSGCGGAPVEVVQPVSTEPPASWNADGWTWQYQASMSQADEETLTKFFHRHAGFQGSSDFEGPPVLMISGKSDRRFYWRRGTPDAISWSCVHFEGGKYRTSEGTGDPFSQ